MRGKKIPLDQRANAVGIAVVAGGAEASRVTGIPEGTIYAWMAKPEFKELRERNNEEMLAEWRTGAQFAFRRAIELLTSTEDPVKAATAGAIIFDKMQLASGGVTSRTESRTWTDGLDADEQRRLRDWALNRLDELDGRTSPAGEGAEGSGVRESSTG